MCYREKEKVHRAAFRLRVCCTRDSKLGKPCEHNERGRHAPEEMHSLVCAESSIRKETSLCIKQTGIQTKKGNRWYHILEVKKASPCFLYYLQPVNNSFGVGGRELADLLQRESIHVKYHIRSGNLQEYESCVYYFFRQTTKELVEKYNAQQFHAPFSTLQLVCLRLFKRLLSHL